VITGTTSARKLSTDVALAAQSTATVVILMAHKLDQIVALFQRVERRNACGYSKRNNSSRESRNWNINTIPVVAAKV
jgi:uroporphyrin-III C-methyltransferase